MRMDFSECYEDSVSGLAAAARSGCRRRLRALIRGGCSLDVRDNRGWTALHQAAAAGSRACVRDLLAAAGGPRARRLYADALTHEGESAMFLAAERGHLRAVRSLLDANANIDQLTNGSSCPLYAAVDGGHTDVVRLLVQRGAEVDRTHTASCWTCLHQAVYKGSVDIVRVLAGVCHLEARDDHGVSPLFVAAQYGRRECLEALISAGASVNSQASDLATPLLISSQEGHESCVALLLAHGADPNRPCSADWPQLPLHAAAQFGHLGVLRRLLAVTGRGCGAGVGWVSPLYLAVYGGQSGGLRLLLGGGFPPDAQDCSAPLGLRSPLALALQREDRLGRAPGGVLNYLLEFVNWSTLPPDLKLVLDRRRADGSWEPSAHFDLVPCLLHLSRLRIRTLLGAQRLMRAGTVQQLPLPPPLWPFLTFRDVPEPPHPD
ncbi:ankyrin repeat and SOCS box protein 3 isoform 5-T5 [Menidia menidia]